jgi:hypothetical protein
LLSGCGGYVAFEVDTAPRGAKVYVDGEFRGVTPTSVMVFPTSGHVQVTLELLNFKPMAWGNVDMHPSEAGAIEAARSYLWNLKPRRH